MLQEGCKGRIFGGPGWVCARLDAVRRYYDRLNYNTEPRWIKFSGELEYREPPKTRFSGSRRSRVTRTV